MKKIISLFLGLVCLGSILVGGIGVYLFFGVLFVLFLPIPEYIENKYPLLDDNEINRKEIFLYYTVLFVLILGCCICLVSKKNNLLKNNSTTETQNKIKENTKISSIEFDKKTVEITEGKTSTLKVNIVPKNCDDTLVWKSSDETVATVSNAGVVTAILAGHASITVQNQDGTISASCDVEVTKEIPLQEVKFNKSNISLVVGDTEKVEITTLIPSDATDKFQTTWESNDTDIATVSYGTITAKKVGSTIIKYKNMINGKVYGILNVTVLPKDKLEVENVSAKKSSFDSYYTITGSITNYTSRSYDTVFLYFYVYDKDGNLIDTMQTMQNGLEQNGTWKFEITTYSRVDEIVSYKLKEIKAFTSDYKEYIFN